MRRSREIIVLLALLLGVMAFVLWFVAQRRAERRAAPTPAPRVLGPVLQPPPSVDLRQLDGRTVDFSSGRPVVRDTAEDRAALAAGRRELEAAQQEVTFEAPRPTPPPPPPPPKR